jgi:hypothetical protein
VAGRGAAEYSHTLKIVRVEYSTHKAAGGTVDGQFWDTNPDIPGMWLDDYSRRMNMRPIREYSMREIGRADRRLTIHRMMATARCMADVWLHPGHVSSYRRRQTDQIITRTKAGDSVMNIQYPKLNNPVHGPNMPSGHSTYVIDADQHGQRICSWAELAAYAMRRRSMSMRLLLVVAVPAMAVATALFVARQVGLV